MPGAVHGPVAPMQMALTRGIRTHFGLCNVSSGEVFFAIAAVSSQLV